MLGTEKVAIFLCSTNLMQSVPPDCSVDLAMLKPLQSRVAKSQFFHGAKPLNQILSQEKLHFQHL